MSAVDKPWSGVPLARRLRAALMALSLLLLLAGGVLVVALRRADRALTAQVQRTFPARLAASQLLTALVNQETGLRGYALTGREEFLTPYRQGVIDEQTARADLERLVMSEDAARLPLLSVDAAITAWRDQYASLRTAGENAMPDDATLEFGRQLFERVRQTNAGLDAVLARQLARAQGATTRARTLVVLVLAVMGAAVVCAVLGLQRALKVSVLGPLSRLAAQVGIVSGGDHTSSIRADGPPDIRRMGEGVESMRLELVGVLGEVESQRRALELRTTELARSNADLEQFAYVASHDLQEPLRKVASFCQLLEQRYHGQLDERADRYIQFAVDGAKRMQVLITDLLTFSRVGRTSDGFASVDLTSISTRSWQALDDQVLATSAHLELAIDDGASCVHGDASLLQMLITNLYGNALKYRHPERTPIVRMTARPEDGMARIDIVDNGIGIPDEYAEKVFVIFQRLHGRDEYEGTGIGLALAKKVVEFHGGQIRAHEVPDGGTCLSFTLPLEEATSRD